MTQSFDEWNKDKKYKYWGSYPLFFNYMRCSYEAGAQSKQAEIDEYKEVASSMEDSYLREKAKVDELRKRIDKTINAIESNRGIMTTKKLINIIKGEEDEQ